MGFQNVLNLKISELMARIAIVDALIPIVAAGVLVMSGVAVASTALAEVASPLENRCHYDSLVNSHC